jgi:hypothetical protein
MQYIGRHVGTVFGGVAGLVWAYATNPGNVGVCVGGLVLGVFGGRVLDVLRVGILYARRNAKR